MILQLPDFLFLTPRMFTLLLPRIKSLKAFRRDTKQVNTAKRAAEGRDPERTTSKPKGKRNEKTCTTYWVVTALHNPGYSQSLSLSLKELKFSHIPCTLYNIYLNGRVKGNRRNAKKERSSRGLWSGPTVGSMLFPTSLPVRTEKISHRWRPLAGANCRQNAWRQHPTFKTGQTGLLIPYASLNRGAEK